MKLLASLGTSSFSSDWGCQVTRDYSQGRHGCDWSATRAPIEFGAGAGPTPNVYLKPSPHQRFNSIQTNLPSPHTKPTSFYLQSIPVQVSLRWSQSSKTSALTLR